MITRKGYVRKRYDGKMRMEHDYVWEQSNGEIPKGHQVHHLNGIKTDNRIENLSCIDTVTHKRIHSGCVFDGNQWHKRCPACGKEKAESEYYKSKKGWLDTECKECRKQRVMRNKKARATSQWKK